MQRVLVVDAQGQPLMPCHPARARHLLRAGNAAVWRRAPFTIRLKERVGGEQQAVEVKVDPGSQTTGVAVVAEFKRGRVLVWAAEIEHRGQQVHEKLQVRAAVRHSRRQRQTRYRPARFDNRRRPEDWLPPSVLSRLENTLTWVTRLRRWCPLTSIALELVKFDTQALVHPEISGVAYQQGELLGYEVREYLLLKWQHRCAYCGKQGVPLQIEHLTPRSRGGSDRLSNLTVACEKCNQRKGTRTAAEFGYPHLQAQAQAPLRDAAAVNTLRWALYQRLQATSLPMSCGTGGRTKFNRTAQGYPKAHWLDAACVGETGAEVAVHPALTPLLIKATGRQARQMVLMDKYGFPRTSAKQTRFHHGFQTGDLVRATVPRAAGLKVYGTVIGRVSARASGSFRVGKTEGIKARYCRLLQRADGYDYQQGAALPLPTQAGSVRASLS